MHSRTVDIATLLSASRCVLIALSLALVLVNVGISSVEAQDTALASEALPQFVRRSFLDSIVARQPLDARRDKELSTKLIKLRNQKRKVDKAIVDLQTQLEGCPTEDVSSCAESRTALREQTVQSKKLAFEMDLLEKMRIALSNIVDDAAMDRGSDARHCSFRMCWNVDRCGKDVKIYVHNTPPGVAELPIAAAFRKHPSAVATVDNSCIAVIPFDIGAHSQETAQKLLAALPSWNGGRNHLVFCSGSCAVNGASGFAAVVHESAFVPAFRNGFDVAGVRSLAELPKATSTLPSLSAKRYALCVRSHGWCSTDGTRRCQENGVHVIDRQCSDGSDVGCRTKAFSSCKFALVQCTRTGSSGRICTDDDLPLILSAGAVPVIAISAYVPPLLSVVDWSELSVMASEEHLPTVLGYLQTFAPSTVQRMSKAAAAAYEKHFAGESYAGAILSNVFADLHGRHVGKRTAKSAFESIVLDEQLANEHRGNDVNIPTVLQRPYDAQGMYTVYVKTEDDMDSVFDVLVRLNGTNRIDQVVLACSSPTCVQSLKEWQSWPLMYFDVSVFTSQDVHFAGLSHIRTKAVCVLDAELQVVSDELELAFDTWIDNQGTLVGFESAMHRWDSNEGLWVYDMPQHGTYSMVTLRAAFVHTNVLRVLESALPEALQEAQKQAGDACLDVLANVLVAMYSHTSPLQVLPMASDERHWNSEVTTVRSQCLNAVQSAVGFQPLRLTPLRSDPVIFDGQNAAYIYNIGGARYGGVRRFP